MPPFDELHLMTADDREQVGALLNDIFRTRSGVFGQDVFTDFPLVFAPANYRNCRVVTVHGRIVSHAALFPCELVLDHRRYKTGIIVLVATQSEHRHQGHAARLMRDLQRTMAEEGYDLGALWTGVPGFYEQLGWETVVTRGLMIEDLLSQSLTGFEAAAGVAESRVAAYEPGKHLDGIRRLHEREPVRISRSRQEYALLLQLPKVSTWVLMRNNEVAAYVVIGQAVNKQGVIEYGGSADDIARLTEQVVRENSFARPLQMLFFQPYLQLAALFRRAGAALQPLESSKGPGVEMIYVVGEKEFPDNARERLFFWGPDST